MSSQEREQDDFAGRLIFHGKTLYRFEVTSAERAHAFALSEEQKKKTSTILLISTGVERRVPSNRPEGFQVE